MDLHVGVAHALTTVDTHERTMRAIAELTDALPITDYVFRGGRPSTEAQSWARVWAAIQQLDPEDYGGAVRDAWSYLRAHSREHWDWVSAVMEREEGAPGADPVA